MLNLRGRANQILKKWEKFFAALSDEELLGYTGLLYERLRQGASLENLLPQAFGAVREATFREFGYPHNVEQLMAGLALFGGKLVEMKTGEGKTLAFTAPAYLAALAGKGVHIVTANEYLARRDCQLMGPVFARLGITCAVVTANGQWLYHGVKGYIKEKSPSQPASIVKPSSEKLRPCSRKEAYKAAITYGTAAAFGFDYLRDNLVKRLEDQLQPQELAYVFLDEADNILLDEARTPLILTGPSQQFVEVFYFYMEMVKRLKQGRDYEVNLAKRTVNLTERGIDRLEKWLGLADSFHNDASLYSESSDSLYYINNCLRALTLFQSPDDYLVILEGQEFKCDQTKRLKFHGSEEVTSDWESHEYIIDYAASKKYQLVGSSTKTSGFSHQPRLRKGQIVLIDKNTGRPLPGRRLQNGLHEALEAKEYLEVQPNMVTLAAISLQSYFRLYGHQAGMSGTLYSDRQALRQLYGLEVASIPTHNPVRRYDDRPQIYKTQKEAMTALVEDALKASRSGAPVLIGTASLNLSEKIADLLSSKNIPFYLLNAKHTSYEAEIIAQAGYPGRITIATNMAGRGTDIKLGGSFESHLSRILEERGLLEVVDRGTPAWNEAVNDAGKIYEEAREIALKAGGLHVLGLGLQASKRLDEQLIGRSGRQGDPGFSRLYLSLEDELVQQNYGTGTSRLISGLHRRDEIAVGLGTNTEYNQTYRLVPIGSSLAIKIMEECQRKIEGQNYDNLKLGFEFDLILDKWRNIFYQRRKLILRNFADKDVQAHPGTLDESYPETCNLIKELDKKWTEFLVALDELRLGVAFQALAGKKILSVYQEEAFKLFTSYFGTSLQL